MIMYLKTYKIKSELKTENIFIHLIYQSLVMVEKVTFIELKHKLMQLAGGHSATED